MAKIGRNQPCPCGSGKKYKRCCWLTNGDVATDRFAAHRARLEDEHADAREQLKHAMSDLALHLIDAGRLDEAESESRRLRDEFPDDPIGLQRLARVHELRGDAKTAVDLYTRAIEQVDDDLDGYFCDHCRNEMVKAIRRLDPTGSSPPIEIEPE